MINGHFDVLTFQLFAYPMPLLNGRGSSSYLPGARGPQAVLLINGVIQMGCRRRAWSLVNTIPHNTMCSSPESKVA